jgi:hypothetical protein
VSKVSSIASWAWRRHGEEVKRASEEQNPLDRIDALGQAQAFQEVVKYLEVIEQAENI